MPSGLVRVKCVNIAECVMYVTWNKRRGFLGRKEGKKDLLLGFVRKNIFIKKPKPIHVLLWLTVKYSWLFVVVVVWSRNCFFGLFPLIAYKLKRLSQNISFIFIFCTNCVVSNSIDSFVLFQSKNRGIQSARKIITISGQHSFVILIIR